MAATVLLDPLPLPSLSPVSVPATPDPSWLPATAATASATLVAIVSALFISRVVAERGELQRLRSEDLSLSNISRVADDELRDVERELTKVGAFEWAATREILEKVIYAQGPVSATKLKNVLGTALPLEELQAQLDRNLSIVRQAEQDITSRQSFLGPKEQKSWWQPRAQQGLGSMGLDQGDPFTERVYEEVYCRLYLDANATKASDLPPVDLKALHHWRPRGTLEEERKRLQDQAFQTRLRRRGARAALEEFGRWSRAYRLGYRPEPVPLPVHQPVQEAGVWFGTFVRFGAEKSLSWSTFF